MTEEEAQRKAWELVNEMVASASLTDEQTSVAMAWPEWIADALMEATNPGWRKVSSGGYPMDGKPVLITDGTNIGEGFWHANSDDLRRAKPGWFWEIDRDNLLAANNASGITHWMPMEGVPTP